MSRPTTAESSKTKWPACPRCETSRDVRRSRRRGLEAWISWLGILPYRCMTCDRRFLG